MLPTVEPELGNASVGRMHMTDIQSAQSLKNSLQVSSLYALSGGMRQLLMYSTVVSVFIQVLTEVHFVTDVV
jgi:hypothetical protein